MGFDFTVIVPLLPSHCGFSFVFGCGVSFLVSSSVFLSMIVQQLVVILVFSQEGVRARPSTPPSWFRTYFAVFYLTFLRVIVRRLYRSIMIFIPFVLGNILRILLKTMFLVATINGLDFTCLKSIIFYVSLPLTRGNSKTEVWGKGRRGFYKREKQEILLW